MDKQKIAGKINEIVKLFVQNDFEEISLKYPSEYKLTGEEIKNAVESYGGELIMPSEEAFTDFEIMEVNNRLPKLYDVRFALWTSDEGKSDLTIVLSVEESDDSNYIVSLRDILVP